MNIIVEKSKSFALNIVNVYKRLCKDQNACILFTQLLRSGTNVGANIKEAVREQSKTEFYAKLFIALKEASETEYWLELLYESGYLQKSDFIGIYADCQELLKILIAIAKHKNQRIIR